ncbi:MAG: DUF2283 domain-containing protein [Candidatus Hodarchaeales archaeon]
MEKTKPLIRMQIEATEIINRISTRYSLSLPHEIIRMGYDAEADVLYAHFEANAEAVDSDILEANENIILGLNKTNKMVRITILNASHFN